jgi:hypothetical protein
MQEQTPTPAIVEHKMPTRERILRIPNKDKSIFYLFIFSIILFLCSLVISFLKKDDIKKIEELTGNNETKIIETQKVEETPEMKISSVLQTVENMYLAINSKSFGDIPSYLDSNLKNSNTIRTYFNAKRLTRFTNNIKDGTLALSGIQQEQLKDYSRKVTYALSYTLLDGQTFTENRNATVVRKNDEYSVATLKCETTGCSRMPFFNPGKYNMK